MIVKVRANPFVPELHLFHSRRKFVRYCKRTFGSFDDDFSWSAGLTVYSEGLAVVLIDPPEDADLASVFALIAHESYHVARMHLEELRETECGEETMAYMVQVISGSLCSAHIDWMASHVGV